MPEAVHIDLGALNALPIAEARQGLMSCCASTRWVEGLLARRPFGSLEQLLEAASEVWGSLGAADWLEAFAAHPRIGGRAAERSASQRSAAWSAREQSGVAGAAQSLLEQLAIRNQDYLEKFGFIFIVFASGKSPEEMLALLEQRINGAREQELRNAAAEQDKITCNRLQKWIKP